MPEMTVWPVSSSVADLEGRVLFGQRVEGLGHLVLVGLGLRLDGDVDDRLGELRAARSTIGLPISARVSPVRVSFMPMAATMSPVKTASLSSEWLACISRIRPTRSFLPVRTFSTWPPLGALPL